MVKNTNKVSTWYAVVQWSSFIDIQQDVISGQLRRRLGDNDDALYSLFKADWISVIGSSCFASMMMVTK